MKRCSGAAIPCPANKFPGPVRLPFIEMELVNDHKEKERPLPKDQGESPTKILSGLLLRRCDAS